MHLQLLEPRRLFSATAYLDGNVLRVIGTDGDDTIVLSGEPAATTGNSISSALQISVNHVVVGNFSDWNSILRIAIEAGDGNDRVTMQDRFTTGESYLATTGEHTYGYRTLRAHVQGGAGNDTISGGAGNDLLEGNGGNDNLTGGAGDDFMLGGTGQDKLHGDTGRDTLDGGAGNDGLAGGADSDVFYGRAGSDAVDYSDHTQPVAVTLWNEGESHVAIVPAFRSARYDLSKFYGMGYLENDGIPSDVENIKGTSGDDVLLGNKSANVIAGGAGDDSLQGDEGPDTLYGEAGNDQFITSDEQDAGRHTPLVSGTDRVVGGPGKDYADADVRDVLVKIEADTILLGPSAS